jgi:hypothetical protein
VVSDDLTEWSGIAITGGLGNLAPLLHELFKIVLIGIHSLAPSLCSQRL